MDKLPLIEFVESVREQLPPLCSVGDDFYFYMNGCWSLVPPSIMLKKVQQRLPPQLRASSIVQEISSTLKIQCQVDPDSLKGAVAFNDGLVLINMEDGVIAVSSTSINLAPHSQAYMFTRKMAVRWDERAECPSYFRCLEEALPDPQDRTLFTWFLGYTLYPFCRHNVFLVLYGPEGGEGKTTLLDAAAAVFGRELLGRASLSQLCNPNGYHIPMLKDFLVNIGSELNAGEVGEADNLKILCEGGDIAVRKIFEKPCTMRNYSTKLIFSSNHLPRFRGGSGAEARRMRIIKFGQRRQADPCLPDRLQAEKNGVFRCIFVPALQSILGGSSCPHPGSASIAVSGKFALENDPHSAFVVECCEFGDGFTCVKANMIAAWKQFVDRHHLPEALVRSTMVYRRIQELNPKVSTNRPGAGAGLGKGGKRPNQFVGVRLKDGYATVASSDLEELMEREDDQLLPIAAPTM